MDSLKKPNKLKNKPYLSQKFLIIPQMNAEIRRFIKQAHPTFLILKYSFALPQANSAVLYEQEVSFQHSFH